MLRHQYFKVINETILAESQIMHSHNAALDVKMKAESLKQEWEGLEEIATPGPTRPGLAPGDKVVNLTDWKNNKN